MPEYAKDVMLGILGASVGLAGLLLVFSGYVFAQAAAFPPATTDDKIINRFRNAGRFGLWPFLLALTDSVISMIWLVHPGCHIYIVSVAVFFLLLVGTAAYGAVLLKFYL
jgi:hypothetical protein